MPPTALHPDPAPALHGVPVVDITATGPGRTPIQQVMELMREHGPVLVRRLHGRDTLFVADADLVADLADEQRFAKHVGPALENVRAFAADGLFTAYNDEPNWAKAHDILMLAFALGSMRTYHPVMVKVARRLIESWDRAARDGRPVDVPDDMTRMTLDTIGLAGFGYDFGSFERAEPHPFVESMVRCLEWSMTRLARRPGTDHSAADAAFRDDADHLARVVDDVIASRTGTDQSTAEDLLGLMLSARHPEDGTTKRFLRVALPDGVTYRTADHLAVLPANDPALVTRVITALGIDPDTVLDIRATRPRRDGLAVDRPLTARQLLTRHVELQERPSTQQLSLLADANPCPPEKAALASLRDDPRTLVEIIEDHPALRGALDWPRLLDLLTPLQPRHYSISSSPAADPRHADLMISLLEAPARSGKGTYRGTGSGHLTALRPGDTIHARVQPCREAFRIDAGAPVVMIAAGTGLAPFRGAVADRTAALAAGAELPPALCYFGCDAADADYLHAEELHAAQTASAVSLRPAFSTAGTFVQHRIAAEADEVWALLEAGARVYVCGDGARMAPGVREAFRTMFRDRVPEGKPDEWLNSLVAEGRFVEDVYASS
ncbi:cytochrome P450 [Streptomyces hyaluromycini]|uniref:cytochrome P450 n=1 Tax=Streptomyces hyaluromycini TaxID=1377993 RepID=UPI000B5CA147|nr:cytochrome P450 [Streptomyces hyaluromycini]